MSDRGLSQFISRTARSISVSAESAKLARLTSKSRSSRRRRCSVRKGVFRNLAKFTGNTRARAFFLIKFASLSLQLYEKETLAQVFLCEFCKISKNTFFIEHFQATTSVNQ